MASKRMANNVSAVKSIEVKIAEFEALKDVVQYIENGIEANQCWIKEYEEEIANKEAESGEKVKDSDYRYSYIKEYCAKISGLRFVLSKLVDDVC